MRTLAFGVGATGYKPPMARPLPLEKMTVQVFDVFGANGYPAVLNGSKCRLVAIDEE